MPLRNDFMSACTLYLEQMNAIEDYLSEHGFQTKQLLYGERNAIFHIRRNGTEKLATKVCNKSSASIEPTCGKATQSVTPHPNYRVTKRHDMMLATRNWKAEPIHEQLAYYIISSTLARIRQQGVKATIGCGTSHISTKSVPSSNISTNPQQC
jgi:hypothetical protein